MHPHFTIDVVLLVNFYNFFSLLSGMNFYDFFIFLARFSLANSVVLDILVRDAENIAGTGSTFPIIQQLVQNLSSIQQIALKMKSLECFSGDQGFVLDLVETHKNPMFCKLCYSLIQICESIHNRQVLSLCSKTVATQDSCTLIVIQNFCDAVSSPQDLVKYIDAVLTEHTSLESSE